MKLTTHLHLSANFKKVWSCTSTVPVCLHGVVLNETINVSLWHGTWLSTGTTLPVPLHKISWYIFPFRACVGHWYKFMRKLFLISQFIIHS